MTDANASWYLQRKTDGNKKHKLETLAVESVRQGDMIKAEEYLHKANSIDYCDQTPPAPRKNEPHPKIGGLIEVSVVRRRKNGS
jgi:hypothetical protein